MGRISSAALRLCPSTIAQDAPSIVEGRGSLVVNVAKTPWLFSIADSIPAGCSWR